MLLNPTRCQEVPVFGRFETQIFGIDGGLQTTPRDLHRAKPVAMTNQHTHVCEGNPRRDAKGSNDYFILVLRFPRVQREFVQSVEQMIAHFPKPSEGRIALAFPKIGLSERRRHHRTNPSIMQNSTVSPRRLQTALSYRFGRAVIKVCGAFTRHTLTF